MDNRQVIRALIWSTFLAQTAMVIVAVATSFLAALTFKAPPFIVGLLGAAGNLAYAAACIPSGWLADRIGCRIAAASVAAMALLWPLMAFAPSLPALFALYMAAGFAIGFFWPPIEVWFANMAGESGPLLDKTLARFNLSWVSGYMLAPVACGYLWELSTSAPFILASAMALPVLAALALLPGAAPQAASSSPSDSPKPIPPAQLRWLKVAWLANSTMTLCIAGLTYIFPKISDAQGYSASLTGWLIFAPAAATLAVFLIFLGRRWNFGLPWLMASQAAAAFAALAPLSAASPHAFALAFAALGAGRGISYMASLSGSLTGSAHRGLRSGVHEAVIGLGLAAGPLIMGSAAQRFGLLAPFPAVAILLCAVMLAEAALLAAPIKSPAQSPSGP